MDNFKDLLLIIHFSLVGNRNVCRTPVSQIRSGVRKAIIIIIVGDHATY